MAGRWQFKWTPEGKAFAQALDEIASKKIKVGFLEGETEQDGTSIADIAAWNELGTEDGRIPSRPFMRQSVENHRPEINRHILAEGNKLAAGASAKEVLSGIGDFFVRNLQKEIRNGDFVPNAPSTVAAKGSDRPLIDTGRMRQSVHFQIDEKDGDN